MAPRIHLLLPPNRNLKIHVLASSSESQHTTIHFLLIFLTYRKFVCGHIETLATDEKSHISEETHALRYSTEYSIRSDF
jgi:hypothetical protein